MAMTDPMDSRQLATYRVMEFDPPARGAQAVMEAIAVMRDPQSPNVAANIIKQWLTGRNLRYVAFLPVTTRPSFPTALRRHQSSFFAENYRWQH